MANDYTTSTDAFADLGVGEGGYSSSDYPAMATMITAASRLVDAEMGRWPGFFYPTTDTVDFYYDGNGGYEIDIDEFASISAVGVSQAGGIESTDYTSLSSSDYQAMPFNYLAKGKPITKLRMDIYNGSGTVNVWSPYPKAVHIAGQPGYSLTLPDIVVQAVKIQAIRYFMRAKQGYQDTGASVDIGGLTLKGELQLDPDVKALLFPLKMDLC